jgi:hypothetical protein
LTDSTFGVGTGVGFGVGFGAGIELLWGFVWTGPVAWAGAPGCTTGFGEAVGCFVGSGVRETGWLDPVRTCWAAWTGPVGWVGVGVGAAGFGGAA